MVRHFVILQWKSFFRSANVGKSIGLRVFLGLLGLYFAFIFLMLGMRLYPLLDNLYPGIPPVQTVNRMVIVWLSADLLVRFFMQSLPVMYVKPLMLLPVKKGKIIHYVLIKSLASVYNIFPLLILIPFGISCLKHGAYTSLQITGWMFGLYCLVLSVNYLHFIFKKKFTTGIKSVLPFVGIALALVALEYFSVLNLREFTGEQFNAILTYPVFSLIPLAGLAGIYFWNYIFLKGKYYLDDDLKTSAKTAVIADLGWTRRFGGLSLFLQQDIKLIWRNKRPRTTLVLALIFLPYGLIFYPNETYHTEMPAMFVFVGIFVSGLFLVNFGQFIPAWDSSYYGFIMAQHIPLRKYLASKAGLLSFSVIILFVLSTPYVWFGWNILALNLACALYNIGINVPVIIYAGSFNRKRINLEKSQFMNYQGTGATQWLVGLPLLLIPLGIWYVLYKITSFEIASLCIGGLGITGMLLRNPMMDRITGIYRKNKYAMIRGFNQQDG